jgi:hypothetical protein
MAGLHVLAAKQTITCVLPNPVTHQAALHADMPTCWRHAAATQVPLPCTAVVVSAGAAADCHWTGAMQVCGNGALLHCRWHLLLPFRQCEQAPLLLSA